MLYFWPDCPLIIISKDNLIHVIVDFGKTIILWAYISPNISKRWYLFYFCGEIYCNFVIMNYFLMKVSLKVNESQYITLFAVSGSVKKLFSFDCVIVIRNGKKRSFGFLYLWLCQYLSFLDIFFNRFCPAKKCEVTPHYLYRDSLTLK